MHDRRRFLALSVGAAAGLAIAPELLAQAAAEKPAQLPPADLYDRDEEAYWSEMRKLFLIPDDTVYLNNGTVGSTTLPILQAIFHGYHETEKMTQEDPEDYPIWGYGAWNEFRDPLAKFVGCSRDEIALVRNATEANSYIANGLDMKPGDEVLMTDEEHPGGEQPWNLKAKRYGIVVKKIELPKPAQNAADILNRINDAITPRTRIIFVSHITSPSGVVLPAKEIATLARSKGILSAFDGAHVCGMMRLNIPEIGCDFYTSSPHKWLFAPKGSGFLYVREDVQDRLWNTIVTAGWNEPQLKAERFQRIGSSNVPSLWGLRAAIEMADKIGMDRIEKRHRAMADHIHAEMLKHGAKSLTSPDPALRCGIATVDISPLVTIEAERWMWSNRKVRIRGGANRIRMSTPYYLRKRDVEQFLAAWDDYRKAAPRAVAASGGQWFNGM
jgi:selenocysteine lyase/cysteine desulfurase